MAVDVLPGWRLHCWRDGGELGGHNRLIEVLGTTLYVRASRTRDLVLADVLRRIMYFHDYF